MKGKKKRQLILEAKRNQKEEQELLLRITLKTIAEEFAEQRELLVAKQCREAEELARVIEGCR
jgi:hypothetical protein